MSGWKISEQEARARDLRAVRQLTSTAERIVNQDWPIEQKLRILAQHGFPKDEIRRLLVIADRHGWGVML